MFVSVVAVIGLHTLFIECNGAGEARSLRLLHAAGARNPGIAMDAQLRDALETAGTVSILSTKSQLLKHHQHCVCCTVGEIMQHFDASHDLAHVRRVRDMAVEIANAEGVDVQLV